MIVKPQFLIDHISKAQCGYHVGQGTCSNDQCSSSVELVYCLSLLGFTCFLTFFYAELSNSEDSGLRQVLVSRLTTHAHLYGRREPNFFFDSCVAALVPDSGQEAGRG